MVFGRFSRGFQRFRREKWLIAAVFYWRDIVLAWSSQIGFQDIVNVGLGREKLCLSYLKQTKRIRSGRKPEKNYHHDKTSTNL